MGSSASRSAAFISRDQHLTQPSNTSSFSSSSLHSQSPVSRALSLPSPLVHHPAVWKGDTDHLVSLISTTYGSLILVDPSKPDVNSLDFGNPTSEEMKVQELVDSTDPLSPDSVINTWELMEGLDDHEFVVVVDPSSKKEDSFLFGKSKSLDYDENELAKTYEIVEHSHSKPLWQHLSEESLHCKSDPYVVSNFGEALITSKQLGEKETKKLAESELNVTNFALSYDEFYFSSANDRIVLYYTSLRGIRKTYEDCCAVRMIFRGFGVTVDEKDIMMDSSYMKELKDAMGGKAVSLPQVFIRGKYIGGAEEIKQLHEVGELSKLLKGFPTENLGLACQSCGDARFVPCSTCCGSRKIFEEGEGKLRRCSVCNENGLIRCLSCCH